MPLRRNCAHTLSHTFPTFSRLSATASNSAFAVWRAAIASASLFVFNSTLFPRNSKILHRHWHDLCPAAFSLERGTTVAQQRFSPSGQQHQSSFLFRNGVSFPRRKRASRARACLARPSPVTTSHTALHAACRMCLMAQDPHRSLASTLTVSV